MPLNYPIIVLGLDEKEVLARQKQNLNKKLGLDVAGGLGIQSDDLFREEDLVMKRETKHELQSQVLIPDIFCCYIIHTFLVAYSLP